MTLLLDTSVLIELEKENKEVLKKIDLLRESHPRVPAVNFIVYFEFLEGIIRRDSKKKEKEIGFLNTFMCINASKRTAQILVELRIKYSKIGINLSLADLIVASAVKEHDLLLITRDNHFKDIEEINKIIL